MSWPVKKQKNTMCDIMQKKTQERSYEACKSEKQIYIYDGAGHAQSHFIHPEEYERDFFGFVNKVMQE